jgi:hypothetical protein
MLQVLVLVPTPMGRLGLIRACVIVSRKLLLVPLRLLLVPLPMEEEHGVSPEAPADGAAVTGGGAK